MADVPAQLADAAAYRAPHRLTHMAQDLAARFHRFYSACRVVSDDAELTQARLSVCAGTKQVLANLLGLVGVSVETVFSYCSQGVVLDLVLLATDSPKYYLIST
jgi:arginyl-tRNA synthetase